MFDVSVEQQALEELEQREEHLRYTVEMNHELPWIADPQGQVLEFTDRWLAATGLTAGTDKGEGWLTVTHPDEAMSGTAATTESVNTGTLLSYRGRTRIES